jgi:malate synthase
VTTKPGTGSADAGIRVIGPGPRPDDSVLSPGALAYVADLVRRFAPRVTELLARRREAQTRYDAGERPVFPEATRAIREAAWRVAPIPPDLLDRRVEITGPVEAKMIINALNSGASVFMADFEDSLAPTWANIVSGQENLRSVVAGRLEYRDPSTGKEYRVGPEPATLMVRPRGWHLEEKHVLVDGRAAPASLVDFGLFFFHNAAALLTRGTGPYFYLPKMQGHLEARLWNDVFLRAQEALGVPRGTIRATVLIETLPAAFEMDEILYELREHSAGLNCGRWDYIFSFIKTLRADPRAILPDRVQVTMTQPFMRAYTQLLVRTCHKRGAHAMGGMAAQIPIRNDAEASRAALDKVRQDKEREVKDGHDGTWVAHPGLVPLAREVFDAGMKGPNQLDRLREDVQVTAADLVAIPRGPRTEEGLRHNVRVGVQYLEAWLRGLGCVPLYHLMEDAATAEISRTQVWQWIRHGAVLEGGRKVDVAMFRQVLDDEMGRLGLTGGRFADARALFESLSTAAECADFLTLPAYERLMSYEAH